MSNAIGGPAASITQAVTNLTLSFALFYANFRMAVFPVHFVYEDGGCSCGNPGCGKNTGKHPMTSHGHNDAVLDDDMIRYWWQGEPDANIGVRTGAESGIVVVDIDPRHNGHVSIDEFLKKYDPLPVTPTVRTGGGGQHLYFAYPAGVHVGSRNGVLPGVDLKGDGGYVLGAGSNHVLGIYEFEPGRSFTEVALAPMPLPLLDLALGNLEERATMSPSPMQAAVGDMLGKGERHPTLMVMAGAMRQKGMSRAGIEAALKAENLARCTPPLEEKEVTKMVTGIMKYPAGSVPKGRFISALPREEVVRNVKNAFESASDPKIVTEQVKWVMRGLVAESAITLITGKPKSSGKTTFTTHMLAKVLDGLHFMGFQTVRSPVVVLTEERTSYIELLKRMGLIGRRDLMFLRYDPGSEATFAEQIAAAREICREIGAQLLVVDTLAQFAALRGDSENDPGSALESFKPLQEAARDGLGVVVIHHEKKSGGDVGDSSRGSTAFTGAADIVLSIRRPEGKTTPKVRVISTLSRYPCTPDTLYVELTESGYERREEAGVVSAAVEKVLLDSAPKTEDEAASIEDIIRGEDIKKPTARKVANELVDARKLRRRGEGVKGDPYLFWNPGQDSFPHNSFSQACGNESDPAGHLPTP